jgi:hypothetical protein
MMLSKGMLIVFPILIVGLFLQIVHGEVCSLGGDSSIERESCGILELDSYALSHLDRKESIFFPANFSALVGSVQYYEERANDFARRNPEQAVPYYIEYGDKYQKRFLSLRTQFGEKTQDWITKTHYGLQLAIEQERDKDINFFSQLEKQANKFRQFCFQTHVQVYVDSGFCELPGLDTVFIASIPDIADVLTYDGIIQAVQVLSACSLKWSNRIVNHFYELFS